MQADAQAQPRLNKAIEAIEAGQPAIAGDTWRWIGMEHAPFSPTRLLAMLDEMDADRDDQGRFSLTPIVRIPQDGDEDFKWAIKQVLDLGVFGVVVPHVDTKEEAVRIVRAMRYPQTTDSEYPEPEGVRGWGTRARVAALAGGLEWVPRQVRRLAAESQRRADGHRHRRIGGGDREHP